MSLLSIPVDDLCFVLSFKAQQDLRYYLNGIQVLPQEEGCLLVATDGHRLAIYHSKEARCDKERILSITNADDKQIRKLRGKLNAVVTVEDEKSHLVVSDTDGEKYIKPGLPLIDGRYPEWQRVVPPISELTPGLQAFVDARYIAALADVIPSRFPGALRFFHDRRDPLHNAVIARVTGQPELMVVIMPMKGDSDSNVAWPSWMAKEPSKLDESPAAEVEPPVAA